MKNNQRRFIEYAKDYAERSGNHIWLGGSFLRGSPTPFSDVDMSVRMGEETLRAFIHGYGDPIYISYTTNPEGIIIVIYEDGVAVDLDVIETAAGLDNGFFHSESIGGQEYQRNSFICKKICQRNDLPYQTARLFHRSLIKYLAGKKAIGVRIANEIAAFLNGVSYITDSDYRNGITRLIAQYHEKYPLDAQYRELCFALIHSIDTECDISVKNMKPV